MAEIRCENEMPADGDGPAGNERPAVPSIKVQFDDGQECLGLLFGWPSRSNIRLIVKHILLGRKARVAILRPDGGERAVWIVRVLWTLRLIDGSYENGAMFLEQAPCKPAMKRA